MGKSPHWRERLLGTLEGQLQLATYLAVFVGFTGASCAGLLVSERSLFRQHEIRMMYEGEQLVEALKRLPSSPKRARVRVEQQQRVEVEGLKAWQVQGRFDWRLPDDAIRIDSPFDLVLLPGEQGESWRLLRPPGLQQNNWRSYPLLGRDLVVDDGNRPG